jgi:ABC-type branched-subunit amino acid transport system permease subunit
MTAYLVTLLVLVSIAILAGLALNIQWGLAGLVNFGVVGFVALGAYTTAILGPMLGWFGAVIAAACLCAIVSMGIALLSIRLDDNYLAIVTLGFGEAVRIVLLNEGWLTGGPLGIANIPRPFEHAIPANYYNEFLAAFSLSLVAAVFLLLQRIVRSPFGRVLRAIRDDAGVAAAMGKDVLLLRTKAFALGGAILGVTGSLHAFYLTYIDPSQFTAIVTAYAFMAVTAGGRGSNTGLLLGAGSILILLEATRFFKDFIPFIDGAQLAAVRLLLIGVGLILLLIFRPQGLLPEPRARASDILPSGASDEPTGSLSPLHQSDC